MGILLDTRVMNIFLASTTPPRRDNSPHLPPAKARPMSAAGPAGRLSPRHVAPQAPVVTAGRATNLAINLLEGKHG